MLWTRDIMSIHAKWDMSFYIYPEDDSAIQSMLKQLHLQLILIMQKCSYIRIRT